MTCEEYVPEGLTEDDLNKLQEHLSPEDFTKFIKEIAAIHGLDLSVVITDEEGIHDPHGYTNPVLD